jgi:hypothetical protein
MRAAAPVLTVTVVLPLTVSDVAVTTALPGATAVTSPDAASTIAIAGALELQLTARPVSVLPASSVSRAVSFVVRPTESAGLSGDTFTEATLASTKIAYTPISLTGAETV